MSASGPYRRFALQLLLERSRPYTPLELNPHPKTDTGHLDAMGGTLHASFDRGSGALPGYPKGLLLYRSGRRIARALVGDARDPSPAGRRPLRHNSFTRLSNAIEARLAAVTASPATK